MRIDIRPIGNAEKAGPLADVRSTLEELRERLPSPAEGLESAVSRIEDVRDRLGDLTDRVELPRVSVPLVRRRRSRWQAVRPWLVWPAVAAGAGLALYTGYRWWSRRGDEPGQRRDDDERQPDRPPAPLPSRSAEPPRPAPSQPLEYRAGHSGTPTGNGNGAQVHTAPTPATAQTMPASVAGSGPRRPRTVADVMTPDPEVVDLNVDVATAARLMRDLDVGVLPVLADGRLAGIITDRDIALGVSLRETGPEQVRVGELMTQVPVTVRPDTLVEEAAKLMGDHQVRRLPVVEGARLVGILSLGDLATEITSPSVSEALEEISRPAAPDR